MLIDVHTHCFPESVALKAIPVLAKRAGIPAHADGTIKNLKRLMALAGIDKSVILPIATKPDQNTTINRWAAGVQDNEIISFGTIHPDFPYWRDEIKWLIEHGIKGIKLHPDYQNFFVDEPRLFPIYEALFQSELIVLFHAGIDIGFPEPCHCTPLGLKKILDAFPGAPIIAAHMGGYRYWHDVEKYLVGKDIFFDTSFSFHTLGPVAMEKIIKAHGPKKILFGSDSPWTHQKQEIINLKSLNLTNREINMILGDNFIDLLKLKP